MYDKQHRQYLTHTRIRIAHAFCTLIFPTMKKNANQMESKMPTDENDGMRAAIVFYICLLCAVTHSNLFAMEIVVSWFRRLFVER